MGLSESVSEFLEGTDARCELDVDGSSRVWGVGDAGPAAAIIVVPPTDALKSVSMGYVQGSLNRDDLWEVVGISLARTAVSSVPDGKTSLVEWIEQLREEGVALAAIEQSDVL